MLQLHYLSSSSSVTTTQYSFKLCPNHSFSPKSFSFSRASKPSGSRFFPTLQSSRRNTHSIKCRQSEYFDQPSLVKPARIANGSRAGMFFLSLFTSSSYPFLFGFRRKIKHIGTRYVFFAEKEKKKLIIYQVALRLSGVS